MSDARISQVSFNTVASLVIVSAISFNPAASTTPIPPVQSFGGGSGYVSIPKKVSRKKQEDEILLILLLK